MAESKMTKQQSEESQEYTFQPDVDIYEDAAGITVLADMPGVSKEGLEVQIDHDSLSLTGKMNISVPKGMEALYADVQCSRYQRSFTLSSELDRDKIAAELKDGVLTVRIPKREELKPRKIEIQS